MTKPPLPERLLDTANNIHSRGAVIAEKMLREAAEALAPRLRPVALPGEGPLHERLLTAAEAVELHDADPWAVGALLREAAAEHARQNDQVDAYREHCHALGQHLIEAHKPGEVDPEAVAILDGYHIGAREVAGGGRGEPGETTLEAALRLLRMAHDRGAFQEPAKARENRAAALARLQDAVDAPASYATLLGAADEAARALRVPLLIAAMQDKDVAELQRLRAEDAERRARRPDVSAPASGSA